jgi:hypothetical protein
MFSYSTAVPLSLDANFGFTQLTDFKSLAKQNLKMLVLTNPGERVMNPDFGVGIKFYLFELTDGTVFYNQPDSKIITQNGIEIETNVQERIYAQTAKYLPYISSITVQSQIIENSLALSIGYYLPSINSSDQFLYIDSNNIVVSDSSVLENQRTQQKQLFRNQIIQASDLK